MGPATKKPGAASFGGAWQRTLVPAFWKRGGYRKQADRDCRPLLLAAQKTTFKQCRPLVSPFPEKHA